jgi:hypothetical protein
MTSTDPLHTLQALIDVLISDCEMPPKQAEELATDMVKLASAHLNLSLRDCQQGLNGQQKEQLATIESWFKLTAEVTPGIKSASFNGDVRSTTVFLQMDSGASNSFSQGNWRVPVKLPAVPRQTLMRTVRQDINRMVDEKNRRVAESESAVSLIDHCQD